MNFIDEVIIEGFWGDRVIKFELNDDINFIIGVNGSGKTTMVNLIVAALMVDVIELDRLDFTKITIKLKSRHSRKKPSVIISKEGDDYHIVSYIIKESATDKGEIYSLDNVSMNNFRSNPRKVSGLNRNRFFSKQIKLELTKLVNVSWLSVHRASNEIYALDENEFYESTVDKKLQELSNRMVRYFSTLGKAGSELLEAFQKTVFLSMLHRKGNKPLFSVAKEIDIEAEKAALEGIFEQFRVPPKDFQNRLDSHFDSLSKAKEKLINSPEVLTTPDVSVLIGTERIDYIVEEWNKLLEKRRQIFEPRDTFISIVNSMFIRKEILINSQNELQLITQSGKNLPLSSLSSGEKQLLIVLGEALLQEKNNWVYIADEPELSLHVLWQEKLVENLRAINPSAQILFATHSPDVVSTFGSKVFDMAEVV
ncbi:AAA family ATPase [uncultured Cobetia sp.]|uniref:AAA family ATPase n=1 Tax=uncultured Cobetia sp. TaxID=410706 RepID=UPI0032B26B19|tara:strand:- start:1367 stop:2638 length:1272 start_codon:yes stop_codon:yes gene_type:complete